MKNNNSENGYKLDNDTINILQVIGGLNRCGAETFIMNVLRAIDKNKYHFIFLCYGDQHFDYEDEAKELGAEIVRIQQPRMHTAIKTIKEIQTIIKEKNVDIIHAHTYYNSVYSILAASRCNIKKIITHSHNTYSEPRPTIIKRVYFYVSKYYINKKSTHLIACGRSAGESLFRRPFTIINNGINIKNFSFSKKNRYEIRNKYAIQNDDILIVHIGRFEEVKNHTFIIKIAKYIIAKDKKYKFMLVGDGPLKNKTMLMAREAGIEHNILFTGNINNVNKVYSAADVIILPSLFEGLPVSLIEAQANGVSIIASSHIDKSVKYNNNFTFLDIKNYGEWATEILKTHDFKHEKPSIKLFEDFEINKCTDKLKDIYDNN